MRVGLPANLPFLGAIELQGGGQTIVGPGSFRVERIKLDNGPVVHRQHGPVR